MTTQPRAYKWLIDWDGDGMFANAHSDVTDRVVAMPTAKRGRNYGDQIYGRSEAGIMEVVLRNFDGLFDNFSPASDLVDKVIPGKRARFQVRKSGISQSFETKWAGKLDRIRSMERTGDANLVIITFFGVIADLTQRRINVPAYQNITVADAWPHLLTAADIPMAERGTLSGNRTMAVWFVRNQRGIDAARELEETELGFIKEDESGTLSHEQENFRETGARRTSQFMINRDANPAPDDVQPRTLRPTDPLKDIANVVTVPVRNFTTGSQANLWTLPFVPSIPAGETRIFIAEYPTPDLAANIVGVNAWVALAANTDYRGNDAADGSGTNRTANLTVTSEEGSGTLRISVTNGHSGTVFLTRLRARGTPLQEGQKQSIEVRDQDSIDTPGIGRRDYLVPAQWISDYDDAESYGGFLVSLLKDPHTRASVSFQGAIYEDEAQSVDLSTRITLQRHGEAEEFFVEAIDHRILRGGQHIVDLLLSPADVFGQTIVLDTGPGLDTGKLAR